MHSRAECHALLAAVSVPSWGCGLRAVGLGAEPAVPLCVHLLSSAMIITLILITCWCKWGRGCNKLVQFVFLLSSSPTCK